MDFDSILWLLLLLAFYLLPQLLGRKKQRGTQGAPADLESPPQPASRPQRHTPVRTSQTGTEDWEDALQQIREALGAPPPPRQEQRPLPPAERERPAPRVEAEPVPDFHSQESPAPVVTPKRRTDKTTPATRSLATRLEQKPTLIAPPTRLARRTAKAISAPGILSVEKPTTAKAGIVERLRHADSAREAVLLTEILGPPRALAPRKRR